MAEKCPSVAGCLKLAELRLFGKRAVSLKKRGGLPKALAGEVELSAT